MVVRCLAGDRNAWEALWRQHRPYVAAALRSWRGGLSPAAVEDLCQDLFRQLWRDREGTLKAFRGRSSLGPYLAVIAIRRAMRERKAPPALPGDVQDPDPAADPVEAEERTTLLNQAFAELPSRELVLIQLVYLEGLKPVEAAATLHLDSGHARVLLHRARERIRTRLVKQGFSL